MAQVECSLVQVAIVEVVFGLQTLLHQRRQHEYYEGHHRGKEKLVQLYIQRFSKRKKNWFFKREKSWFNYTQLSYKRKKSWFKYTQLSYKREKSCRGKRVGSTTHSCLTRGKWLV